MKYDVPATYVDKKTDVFSTMNMFDPSEPIAYNNVYIPIECPAHNPWGDKLLADTLLPPRKYQMGQRRHYHNSVSSTSSSNSEGQSSGQSSRADSPEEAGYFHNGVCYYNSYPVKVENLPADDLYKLIINSNMIANAQELVLNGFPMLHPAVPSMVFIPSTQYTHGRKMFADDNDLARVCCRCQDDFEVSSGGSITDLECRYHPKAARFAYGGKFHECCGQVVGAIGCTLAKSHVFDTVSATILSGFKVTPAATGIQDDRSSKVYGIDCEMVYTTKGPALARVTVVSTNFEPVLDILVKPEGQLICPNTMYSGLTEADVECAVYTLETAREKLFELVNEDTILVGHSLESDLKALRVVHHRVADTSILFSREDGGCKKALRFLASTILNKRIQHDAGMNHDSYEDAATCLELLMHKLNYF